MKSINVLSLCDGMSCGQIALNEIGIPIDTYYASEIEPNAIKVTQTNFPATIQLGDVTKIDEHQLSSLPKIHLVMFGSPCKSLTVMTADRPEYNKGLDGKSKIFYDCIRILNYIREFNNPDVKFLIENVVPTSDKAKERDIQIMSEMAGVDPVIIDSADFSAQERLRYYWTNIVIPQIVKECKVVLGDILDKNVDEYYYYDDTLVYDYQPDKRRCASVNLKGHDFIKRAYNPKYKSPTLTACRGGNTQQKVYVNGRVRKLTENEYRKLQTIPDWVKMPVARGQIYNLCGDGWTIKVIEHILKGLQEETDE